MKWTQALGLVVFVAGAVAMWIFWGQMVAEWLHMLSNCSFGLDVWDLCL